MIVNHDSRPGLSHGPATYMYRMISWEKHKNMCWTRTVKSSNLQLSIINSSFSARQSSFFPALIFDIHFLSYRGELSCTPNQWPVVVVVFFWEFWKRRKRYENCKWDWEKIHDSVGCEVKDCTFSSILVFRVLIPFWLVFECTYINFYDMTYHGCFWIMCSMAFALSQLFIFDSVVNCIRFKCGRNLNQWVELKKKNKYMKIYQLINLLFILLSLRITVRKMETNPPKVCNQYVWILNSEIYMQWNARRPYVVFGDCNIIHNFPIRISEWNAYRKMQTIAKCYKQAQRARSMGWTKLRDVFHFSSGKAINIKTNTLCYTASSSPNISGRCSMIVEMWFATDWLSSHFIHESVKMFIDVQFLVHITHIRQSVYPLSTGAHLASTTNPWTERKAEAIVSAFVWVCVCAVWVP